MSGRSHPSYKKQFVDPEGDRATTSKEYAAHIRRQSKQKNVDKRFNSPFAFHEPKYKRISLMNRYPRAFVFGLTTVSLLAFYSKPIYDATIREPSQYELDRANFLKKRMQERGWWDNPFWKSDPVKPDK